MNPSQWLIGLVVLVGAVCVQLSHSASYLLAITAAYSLIRAIAVFAGDARMHLPGMIQASLDLRALYVFVGYSMVTIPMTILPTITLKKAVGLIGWATVLNAIIVIIGALFGLTQESTTAPSGYLDYPGMNACLIAMCLGTVLSLPATPTTKRLSLFLCAVAIFLSRSSIPYGVAGVTLASYFYGLKMRGALVIALSILLGSATEQFYQFFNSGWRFEAYRIFMTEWWGSGEIWFGRGPGSFALLSQFIQMKHNFMMDHHWPWLHSDWLQCLFEFGVVGFVLYLVLFLDTVRRCRYIVEEYRRPLLSLTLGFASSAVFDYPMRYFLGSVLASYIAVTVARLSAHKDYLDSSP